MSQRANRTSRLINDFADSVYEKVSTYNPCHDREEPRDGRDELAGPVVPSESLGGRGVVGVSAEGPTVAEENM